MVFDWPLEERIQKGLDRKGLPGQLKPDTHLVVEVLPYSNMIDVISPFLLPLPPRSHKVPEIDFSKPA